MQNAMGWLWFFPPGSPKYLCTCDLHQFRQRLSAWGEITPKKKISFHNPIVAFCGFFLLIVRVLPGMWMSDARIWMAWVRISGEVKNAETWTGSTSVLVGCRVKGSCWGSSCKKIHQILKSKSFQPYCPTCFLLFTCHWLQQYAIFL